MAEAEGRGCRPEVFQTRVYGASGSMEKKIPQQLLSVTEPPQVTVHTMSLQLLGWPVVCGASFGPDHPHNFHHVLA